MEKPPDFIIWAYGRALKLQAGPVAAAAQPAGVALREPTIPELAGLGIGRRQKRG